MDLACRVQSHHYWSLSKGMGWTAFLCPSGIAGRGAQRVRGRKEGKGRSKVLRTSCDGDMGRRHVALARPRQMHVGERKGKKDGDLTESKRVGRGELAARCEVIGSDGRDRQEHAWGGSEDKTAGRSRPRPGGGHGPAVEGAAPWGLDGAVCDRRRAKRGKGGGGPRNAARACLGGRWARRAPRPGGLATRLAAGPRASPRPPNKPRLPPSRERTEPGPPPTGPRRGRGPARWAPNQSRGGQRQPGGGAASGESHVAPSPPPRPVSRQSLSPPAVDSPRRLRRRARPRAPSRPLLHREGCPP